MPEQPKDTRRIWPISVAIHLVLLGVIFFIPAKEYFEADPEKRTPKPPEIKRRGEDLERVMEQVRDITAERLAQKVALLDQGEDRMNTNFQTLNVHHQPLEEQQRATALDRMAAFAERTLADMETRKNKLKEALKKNSPAETVAGLEGAEPLGSRILVGQEEIRRGLMFLAPDDEDLVQAQTEAEETQISSVEFLGWGLGTARRFVSRQESVAELKTALPEARAELESLSEREDDLVSRQEKPKTKLEELRRERRQKDLSEERRAAIMEQLKELEKRHSEIFDARREARNQERRQEREVSQLERRLEGLREKADDDHSWEEHLPVARNTQNAAFYKQRDVVNTLLEKAGKEPIFTDEEKREKIPAAVRGNHS